VIGVGTVLTEIEAAGEGATPLAAEVEIVVAAEMLFVARVVVIAAVAAEIEAVTEADEEFYEKPTITAADINRFVLTRARCGDSQYD
jgi:hypothetical protein